MSSSNRHFLNTNPANLGDAVSTGLVSGQMCRSTLPMRLDKRADELGETI